MGRFVCGHKYIEKNVSEFEERLPSGGDSGGDLNGPGSFWSKSTRPSTCRGQIRNQTFETLGFCSS